MLNARVRSNALITEYQKFRTVFPQVIRTRWRVLEGRQSNAASAKILKISADAIHFSPKNTRTNVSENMARYVTSGITAKASTEKMFRQLVQDVAALFCR